MPGLVLAFAISGCTSTQWISIDAALDSDIPTARHESALVAHEDKLYLIGGRRNNPTDVYDPATQRWTQRASPPIEIHHMQAVSHGDAIYLIGAVTGGWPTETPVDRVLKYYPSDDRYEWTHEIPPARRRGGAGVVVHDDKIYLIGGITHGHMSGSQAWFDEYDPTTGQWRVLPDAPNARDHVHGVVSNSRLYVFAGRRTSRATGQDLDLTVAHGNVFDFKQARWLPVTEALRLPTQRAGAAVMTWDDEIIVAGGESASQVPAHNEVEAYNTRTATWRRLPSLQQGRHGTALAVVGDDAYIVAGSGKRGGEPELIDIERLTLPALSSSVTAAQQLPQQPITDTPSQNTTPVYQQWHTVTLNFAGPATSETEAKNPFTDYRLQVLFENGSERFTIRGFYAADGKAADSGADSGNIWQVRFAPPTAGEWHYVASFDTGEDIVLLPGSFDGEPLPLANSAGHFTVMPSDKSAPDFRAIGQLGIKDGYFVSAHDSKTWIKGGTNSPENLLAFYDFDGTYRVAADARDGEAAPAGDLHHFAPHLTDWRDGDPTWRDARGKEIVGAINYLADSGMNAAYFLTMNITGDGNDIWPYLTHEHRDRFDVSKLAQWERLFAHMQRRGIMLHVVTQETENERLLDDGDTRRERKLYLAELIARFAHHPGLVWNLGEENGPTDWSPHAQNTVQRESMARYIAQQDPYSNPVLLHTHATAHHKDEILTPLLGFDAIDGLSFQVDDPKRVNAELIRWREAAARAGHDWLITMDEIGPWHTGAVPDADSTDNHQSLRRHVLWGSLLAGSAGVEWYFGAKFDANDLTSEDWRKRDSLWQQTRIATQFMQRLSLRRATPCNALTHSYCLALNDGRYLIYSNAGTTPSLDLSAALGDFQIDWLDVMNGGALQKGSLERVTGNAERELGNAPMSDRDWVVLVSPL
ncbi:MAG: DUF5060 domain-containing protein [Pseudomonadota bacterium]